MKMVKSKSVFMPISSYPVFPEIKANKVNGTNTFINTEQLQKRAGKQK